MDDITEKITSLLNDPQGMETIRNIAQSFMGAQNTPPEPKEETPDEELPISPAQLSGMMQMLSALQNNRADDKRTHLLLALKPHLSEERQKKVDKAVKLLKLSSLLPLIQESGLFNLL